MFVAHLCRSHPAAELSAAAAAVAVALGEAGHGRGAVGGRWLRWGAWRR